MNITEYKLHWYTISNILSSETVRHLMMSRMKEKYISDFVLEILNTPHWGLLTNKNRDNFDIIINDNLIKKAVD